jgi:hypothetical protein
MTTLTTFRPSQEQVTIGEFIARNPGNLLVQAYAGCGKTTTAIEIISRVLKAQGKKVAILMFSRGLKEETALKVTAAGLASNVDVKSFNGHGYSGILKAKIKPEFSTIKTYCEKHNIAYSDKAATNLSELERIKSRIISKELDIPRVLYSFILSKVGLLNLARNYGMGIPGMLDPNSKDSWNMLVDKYDLQDLIYKAIEGDKDFQDIDPEDVIDGLILEGQRLAYKALKLSISLAERGIIDFIDQMYLTVLKKLPVTKYDVVIGDELQDINPIMLEIIAMSATRYIGIGDVNQAIMGFAGADSQSMDLFKSRFNAEELTLSLTYRCPKAIVRRANQIVPGIQAHETNKEGTHQYVTTFQELDLKAYKPAETAIISRTNASLAALYFFNMSRGIPCKIKGKNIGDSIVALVQVISKAGTKKEIKSLQAFQSALEVYKDKEIKKLLAKEEEEKAAGLQDKIEVIEETIANLKKNTLQELTDTLQSLFGDDIETLTLISAHKSKGLEFNNVILMSAYFPNKLARKEWAIQQEKNLEYVAVTRSKDTLIEITSKFERKPVSLKALPREVPGV